MHAGMSEFVAEHMKGLTEMVTELRRSRVAAARKARVESAARIKSLNQRVRSLARSGVRVTAASQGAVQSLIELQEDIVTSALDDAAAQMERLASPRASAISRAFRAKSCRPRVANRRRHRARRDGLEERRR